MRHGARLRGSALVWLRALDLIDEWTSFSLPAPRAEVLAGIEYYFGSTGLRPCVARVRDLNRYESKISTSTNWTIPIGWRPSLKDPPLLRDSFLHAIAFVTDRRPSAAVQLAVRHNPGVSVFVLAPPAQRERVLALNATWVNFHDYGNRVSAFQAAFRQGSPGSRRYHVFCHVRWLVLAAALHKLELPVNGAIAVLDDDVLLFERLSSRLREAAAFHPLAQAETVVSGAFVLATASALARLAAFLWALYALPTDELAAIAWRYGEPKPLKSLSNRDRERIDVAFRRGGTYARFSDMDAVEAFRSLARSGHLPSVLAVRWAAGHRRSACTHAPKLEKLGIDTGSLLGNATAFLAPLTSVGRAQSSNVQTQQHAHGAHLTWQERVPHLQPTNKPLCFLHLQGPQAKQALLAPMLNAAGATEV